ncbi:hypothetical protein WMY93_018691 [Mugilogobius chulae]|uniref:SH3 domain-containing protein n=1 Tax=Mugilogobius chulae TaxID=88201 RepID=A0AAW0NUX6_9GOBI
MTLNMKNYKGYKKRPYCNAHYPTTKFTAVADTPENLRLKKNSENQSSIAYDKSSQKPSEQFVSVSDDPESLRTKKTLQQNSNIQYENEKKRDESVSVPEPEPAPPAPTAPGASNKRFRALYDYTAADDDEVSFVEGDVIIDAEQIDEGFMNGTVERTGEHGMLPSNYVEAI